MACDLSLEIFVYIYRRVAATILLHAFIGLPRFSQELLESLSGLNLLLE